MKFWKTWGQLAVRVFCDAASWHPRASFASSLVRHGLRYRADSGTNQIQRWRSTPPTEAGDIGCDRRDGHSGHIEKETEDAFIGGLNSSSGNARYKSDAVFIQKITASVARRLSEAKTNNLRNFQSHHYIAFWDKGINAIINDGVEMGGEILQAQVKASNQSRTSVIRFEENYASSIWFPNHLVGIMENMKTEGESVFPVLDPLLEGLAPEVAKKFIRRNISNWKKDRKLGGGAGGEVYEGIAEHQFPFAIKEVPLEQVGMVDQLQREIDLLSRLKHENIIQYYGFEKDESKAKLYIFLELATQGSLKSLYQRHCLQDSHVPKYTKQILCGLKYLHDQNVIHRDIKCANILVDANGSIKLSDFGLAKVINSDPISLGKGTVNWMAPEVIKEGYGLPADIWSLGCTVLEMLSGKLPYHGLPFQRIWYQQQFERKLPDIPESLPKDAKKFIEDCLQFDPNDRPTATELLDHSFVMQ